ncbi:MAG: ferredoxin reductase [Wenzhouxiangella sp.]|nr:MAG: ferredoxin reductase [Wenzhouxiangella sp.]
METALDSQPMTAHYSEHLFTQYGKAMTTAAPTARTPTRTLLVDAIRPLSDVDAWNRLLAWINPLWSANEIRARVVRRTEESADTLSLWLRPNRHWRGHRAGQHVVLGVEIDGVLCRRVFSLSNSPRSGELLRLTIQRQAGGGVTDWLHRHARVGLIVGLSAADGDFVLPDPAPQRLLLIAGGSGITPMMAMLQQLADQAFAGEIFLLQLCRRTDQRLFAGELADLAQRLPGLSVHVHASAGSGRLAAERIPELVPDPASFHTMLCGPESLMNDVATLWAGLGLAAQLDMERFAAPRPPSLPGPEKTIQAAESEHMFTQFPGLTLLEAAEAAGLKPSFGCRAGLCRTCLCLKRSGTTRNLLTGLSSTRPDEWIQLCVSVAESDLELSL